MGLSWVLVCGCCPADRPRPRGVPGRLPGEQQPSSTLLVWSFCRPCSCCCPCACCCCCWSLPCDAMGGSSSHNSSGSRAWGRCTHSALRPHPSHPSQPLPSPPSLSPLLQGWFLPSNIAVPAFGNESLFGLLHSSILEELAHFPTGPALTDPFWLYLITWCAAGHHMGWGL